MTGSTIDVGEARAALARLPEGPGHGETPAPGHVYLPRSHVKAMEPDRLLVTGMRGAGKTFWWNALQDGDVWRLIGEAEERPPLNEHTEVRAGFGVKPAPDDYPDKDTFRELMNAGFEPRTAWRTIQAWHLARDGHPPHSLRQQESWGMRTKYVAEHPEAIERLLQERDAELDRKGVCFLIVFDGLDRCADDWKETFPGDPRPVASRCRDALVPEAPGEGLSALRSGRRRQRGRRLPGRLEGARLEGRSELAPP